MLEQITTITPSAEEPDIWHDPWNAILNTLFLALKSYMVSARNRHIEKDAFGTRRHSDLIMEIVKVIDGHDPKLDGTVLIFEIKSSCHWERASGKEALIQHIAHGRTKSILDRGDRAALDLRRNRGRAGSEAPHRVA